MHSFPIYSGLILGLMTMGCASSEDDKDDRPQSSDHGFDDSEDGGGPGADSSGSGEDGDAGAGGGGGSDEPEPGEADTGSGGSVEGDGAILVTAVLPANMACGEVVTASVTMRNVGATAWTRDESYKLGMVDDEDPFFGPDTRVWLPEDTVVSLGHLWSFTFEMTAPTVAGTYVSDWQMVRENVGWFGEQASTEVIVVCDESGTGTSAEWTEDACARNGSEICDDELFYVEPGRRYGLKCAGPEGGISFISTNTGPEMSDGMERCQGWEEQGESAWDHLDYVESFVCSSERIVEVDLSEWSGGYLWFGSHDHPYGEGHMTNTCLVSRPE
jgi:hypothetical protein